MAEKKKAAPKKIKENLLEKKIPYPTVGELNGMTMWEEIRLPFANVRRVPGGYIFEYETGPVFISNDEFTNI